MKITNYRPVVFVTVSLLLGLAAGGLAYEDSFLMISIPIVLVALGIFMLIFLKKKLVFFVILFFTVGFASFKIDNLITFSGEIEQKNAVVTARIKDNKGKYAVFDNLTVNGTKYKGRLTAPNAGFEECDTGYIVCFTADITTNDVDIFDSYRMAKYRDKVYYEAGDVRHIQTAFGTKKLDETIRDRVNDGILCFMSEEEGGIAISLVFGEMSYITEQDNSAMRNTGLSHIFSVSGLHVGFLIAIVLFIAKRLRLNAKYRFLIILVMLIAYGFLTGFPSGVKRAGIMSLVYLFGVLMGRKNDSLTTLSLSVMIIVLTNPRELFDVSFIMSAAAILGTVCYYAPLKRLLSGNRPSKAKKYLAASLAATISANIFLVPVSFNVFNMFSTYQAISNMLLLPLVTVIYTALMPVAVLNLIFAPLGVLYVPISYPITLLRLVTNLIAVLPLAKLNAATMGVFTGAYLAAAVVFSPFIRLRTQKAR
ncbi:MAG TPA: ComEC/Rec2 family competence protein [Clostridia bacterium]|nr:ComEC/Rec2 family competence protein [Clostridia bacterium]